MVAKILARGHGHTIMCFAKIQIDQSVSDYETNKTFRVPVTKPFKTYRVPGIDLFVKLICTSYAHDAWGKSFVTNVTVKEIHNETPRPGFILFECYTHKFG